VKGILTLIVTALALPVWLPIVMARVFWECYIVWTYQRRPEYQRDQRVIVALCQENRKLNEKIKELEENV
jgi:hypothetical protein